MRELLPSPASSQTVTLDLGDVSLVSMFGVHDEVLREVEAQCPGVSIVARGNTITLSGPDPSLTRAQELLEDLRDLAGKGVAIVRSDVARTVDIQATTGARAAGMLSTPIVSSRGHSIRPKTVGQKNYVDAIDDHTIVFGIGPAGTGKTYLAMAKAVAALEAKQVDRIILTRPALEAKQVDRIILTRPAVEAGERLGFLPGTLTDKIDPYLRPLFDALHEMMDPDLVPKLLASGTVEVAPLAYMRGRTLNSAFIILDEAQNTSPEQMKMFLTRLGFGSKMIITGDVTQVDLPTGASGLTTVGGILDELEDIHFEYLSAKDVVRHSLVSRIVDAYAEFEASKRGR